MVKPLRTKVTIFKVPLSWNQALKGVRRICCGHEYYSVTVDWRALSSPGVFLIVTTARSEGISICVDTTPSNNVKLVSIIFKAYASPLRCVLFACALYLSLCIFSGDGAKRADASW